MNDSSSKNGLQARLKDGRSLGYAEYGDPTGRPVLFFPGAPSSRLLHPPEGPTLSLGARVIVVERPGFGLSDFQKGRTLLDWPEDVIALADALGIERFPVVAVSAGGPYAAACAFKIPERVTKAAIIGGVGPTDLAGAKEEMPRIRRAGAAVARRAPWLLRVILWVMGNPNRNPERFFQRMAAGNSPVDQEIIFHPEIRRRLMENYREATRAGVRGFAREAIILSNSWGFSLEDISIPVHVWHGEEDANVSLSAARHVANKIPDCHATFLPGEGHWLHLAHWEEILRALLS